MDFNLDGSETCWLIYADWLYDHDQPEKADLIRKQQQFPKRRQKYTINWQCVRYVGTIVSYNREDNTGVGGNCSAYLGAQYEITKGVLMVKQAVICQLVVQTAMFRHKGVNVSNSIVQLICKHCKNPFEKRPDAIYCSPECEAKGRKRPERPVCRRLMDVMEQNKKGNDYNWSVIGRVYNTSPRTVRIWAEQYGLVPVKLYTGKTFY